MRAPITIARRGRPGSFFLEKWYVDTLLPDGGVFIAYLARIRLLGFTVARVTADFFSADGARRSGSAVARHVSGGHDRLVFGPAHIEGDRFVFTTDEISGSLRFSTRWAPVTLVNPFVKDNGGKLEWQVEIPDADVSGELRTNQGRIPVCGRGYRDHVWFDFPLWRFPIRKLSWGRAAAGAHAATWVEAVTAHGEIRARWEDGRAEVGDARSATLGASRLLLETHVADLEGLRLGPLRPVLRRLSKDPVERKWAAEAELGGDRGRAIHEVATWS